MLREQCWCILCQLLHLLSELSVNAQNCEAVEEQVLATHTVVVALPPSSHACPTEALEAKDSLTLQRKALFISLWRVHNKRAIRN